MPMVVTTPSGPAWIDLQEPDSSPRSLLVLGHGAGGGVNAPDLTAVSVAAVEAGIAVARVTQPYRVAGRRSPAPAPRLDEAWLAVLAALRQHEGFAELPLIQGGRSSGARVACRTATPARAAAVVALAFPVHPPGKPERSRLAELAQVRVPVLVVQGDRDAFGMPAADSVTRLVVINGADHSLKKSVTVIATAVVEFVSQLS
ncbi:MAG: alpha/beta hydrolase [Actinomycetota bacterium]|nr:alpha/beta hydrolase [Actinomycetota bacterium]